MHLPSLLLPGSRNNITAHGAPQSTRHGAPTHRLQDELNAAEQRRAEDAARDTQREHEQLQTRYGFSDQV